MILIRNFVGVTIFLISGLGVMNTAFAHGFHNHWLVGHYDTDQGIRYHAHRHHYMHTYIKHCQWVTNHDDWGDHYKARQCHRHHFVKESEPF